MARCWVLLLTLLAAPAIADAPDCPNVLLDASRPLKERRALALQCQQVACEHDAKELQLAPDAERRYMATCMEDHFDQIASAGSQPLPAADAATRDCLASADCKDLEGGLDATAAGLSAGRGSDAGHTFVRVQRINEVIER